MTPSPESNTSDADLGLINRLLESEPTRCPVCEMGLVAPLGEKRCPGCAEPLSLRLGLAEPMTGSIIAGAVGLGAAFGFAAPLSIYILYMSFLRFRGSPPDNAIMLVSGGGALATGVLLIGWTSRRGRNWLRHRSRLTRGLLVGICWLIPPAVFYGIVVSAN